MNSRLYVGHVLHRRFGAVRHEFRYPLFMVLLDLDELPDLFDRYWGWSARRPALAWFRRADFLGDPARPLADCVRDRIREVLGTAPTGPIRLLTHLRYFGHNFNPVSFYYCYGQDGTLQVIVAEITNTPWKERHSYVLGTGGAQSQVALPPYRFAFDKVFHVSPFLPMDLHYRWHFGEPGPQLQVYMEDLKAGQRVFDASLQLRARPISGGTLTGVLLRFPAMTALVLARIYWQALKLLLKRTTFHTHPDAPHV